jgi:hypothetical protein
MAAYEPGSWREETVPSPRLMRVGGYCGLAFSVVWLICSVSYLIIVGLPPQPPDLAQSVELFRRSSYQLLFWLWPLAYLAAIPFSLAAGNYLKTLSPAWSRLGTAFLLLYAGLWFVYHAMIMAGFSIAQADPVNEVQLSLIFILTRTMGSPLFWAIIFFEASWATCLVRRSGLHGFTGWAFLLGSISSLIYFFMRYTGPYRVAEVFHEILILFMIAGIGSFGILLLRSPGTPGPLDNGNEVPA